MTKIVQYILRLKGGLISCLAQLIKPKPKRVQFNPQMQGFPPAIFKRKSDRIVPEMTIGRKFIGPDGGEWEVVSFEQDKNRDLLPADGVMTIKSV